MELNQKSNKWELVLNDDEMNTLLASLDFTAMGNDASLGKTYDDAGLFLKQISLKRSLLRVKNGTNGKKEIKNKRVSFAVSETMFKEIKKHNLDMAELCRQAIDKALQEIYFLGFEKKPKDFKK